MDSTVILIAPTTTASIAISQPTYSSSPLARNSGSNLCYPSFSTSFLGFLLLLKLVFAGKSCIVGAISCLLTTRRFRAIFLAIRTNLSTIRTPIKMCPFSRICNAKDFRSVRNFVLSTISKVSLL